MTNVNNAGGYADNVLIATIYKISIISILKNIDVTLHINLTNLFEKC